MKSKPHIKAGHLENLTDARYFAARDVSWLGFLLDENDEEAITLLELNAIKEWVEGPKIIAEVGFVGLDSDALLSQLTGIDGIQVSAFSEIPKDILNQGQVVIREIIIQEDGTIPVDIQQFDENEILLFDLEKNQLLPGNLEKSMDAYIQWLKTIVDPVKSYILDVPFIGQDLYVFVQSFQPQAIQLKGSEEEKIGFKSYDDIDAYFDYFEDWA